MGDEQVPAVHRRRWFEWRGDLRPRTFPKVSYATAADRQEAVELLRQWAEHQAEDTIQWYQRDKRPKRTGSKLIRAAAVILAVMGGVAPLQTAATGGHVTGLGYVLLAVAAGLMGFDYFFGVSSGWMRDIAALQAVQQELARFQLAWAALMLQDPSQQADADGRDLMARQISMISDFAASIGTIVESETTDWLSEFRSSLRRLHDQAGASRSDK